MAVFKVKNKEHGTKVRSKVEGAKPRYKLWGYKIWYTDLYGVKKQYLSKKYFTRGEAVEAEKQWNKDNKTRSVFNNDMVFSELHTYFRNYKKDMVTERTLQTYKDRQVHLKLLDKVKVADFNMEHFRVWREEMNKKSLATITKNDVYKYLKVIFNFAMKHHDIDIMRTYSKMEGFYNPSELKKEMDFYTDEEFKRVISFETDLKYVALFMTLYYCGLRNGELRGLTWQDIDFEKGEMNINKQVPTMYSRGNFIRSKHLTNTKTKSSVRRIPISKTLYVKLEEYYNVLSKYKNFEKSWFVFGDFLPIVSHNPAIRLELREKVWLNTKLWRLRM